MSLEAYNEYIESLYERTNGNISQAREIFYREIKDTISGKSIRKRWKNAGFPLKSHGGYRHGMTDDEVRRFHEECDGDLIKMAEKSGYKPGSLANRCNSLKLHTKNNPKRRRKSDVTVFDEPYDAEL